MRRLAPLAVPLVLALLAGCGGSDTPTPVPVTCGATANGGLLTVNDPAGYTCGTATSPTANVYTFTAGASAQHTVRVDTTSGDADLCVRVQGGAPIDCSINIPPTADVIAFPAAAGTVYEVSVEDASFTPPYTSSYGVKVTSP